MNQITHAEPEQTGHALAIYDRMCSAIAECVAVDEVKDIRDKALALEAYYRQARNLEAERDAANVRIMAECRAGELLKDLERADSAGGGDVKSASRRGTPIQPSPFAKALKENGISKQDASRFQKLASIPKEKLKAALAAPQKPTTRGLIKGAGDANRTSFTGDNQWFTPPEHIERARAAMGGIDLDPASHELAQKAVKAAEYFTEDDDGLVQPWAGRVWLNPPYAQPAIGHFIDKMVSEVTAGNVAEAVMLTHNYTDTAWFQKAAAAASCICFTRGRIRFVSPDGEVAAPTQGQAFFYFGPDPSRFIAEFHGVGFLAEVRR